MAPAKESQKLVPSVLQTEERTLTLNTRTVRQSDGSATQRHKIEAPPWSLSPKTKMDLAQTRGMLETQPPTDPVEPVGVAKVLAVL